MTEGLDARGRLAVARLYLCTDARLEQNDLAQFIEAACAGGVDVVQLRDKRIDRAAEMDALAVIAEVCGRANALWVVNDHADLAALTGSPAMHLGQDDLPVPYARDLIGTRPIVGRSTHSFDQATAAALQSDIDYFAVGPVWETPTKPGRRAIGVDTVRDIAHWAMGQDNVAPWFAIGGINSSTIAEVVDAGAHRIAVVRAITEAADPQEAAANLVARLPPLTDEP